MDTNMRYSCMTISVFDSVRRQEKKSHVFRAHMLLKLINNMFFIKKNVLKIYSKNHINPFFNSK